MYYTSEIVGLVTMLTLIEIFEIAVIWYANFTQQDNIGIDHKIKPNLAKEYKDFVNQTFIDCKELITELDSIFFDLSQVEKSADVGPSLDLSEKVAYLERVYTVQKELFQYIVKGHNTWIKSECCYGLDLQKFVAETCYTLTLRLRRLWLFCMEIQYIRYRPESKAAKSFLLDIDRLGLDL